MSLLTSFNSGVSGLRAAQSGLNTTGHNLANTATIGYTRQQNIQTDMQYNNLRVTDKGSLQVGYGVSVAQVRQIRDMFLDKEYRLEVSRQSFYETQLTTAQEIEDMMGEMEGVEFQNSLQDLWNSLQNISNNSQSIVNRELFISESVSFLKKAQDVYQSLQDYQINLNREIQSQVDEINSIGEQIAECNRKIAEAEASGLENANDYRDARNQLMDELADYTYYTYNEDEAGKVNIYIDNAPLVMENRSFHMGCEKIQTEVYDPVAGKYVTASTSEMLKAVWKDNGYGDVYDVEEAYSSEKYTDTGSLQGILVARGNKVANYTDIPVKPKKDDYYDAAGNFDSAAYEIDLKHYENDLEVFNNTTANSIITKVEAQFDQLINGVVKMINDALNPEITQNITGITGTDAEGNAVTLDGDYKILDVINCPVGTDDDVTIGTEVFSRRTTDRYQVLTLNAQIYGTDADGNAIPLAQEIVNPDGTTSYKLYVYNEEDASDPNTLYTLQNLEVNPDLVADYSLLQVKENPALGGTGAYNTVFEDMLAQWGEDFAVLDPNHQTAYSFDKYYQALITDLAAQGSTWQSVVDNQTKLVESVEDKRQQVAGVSTEEELSSLLMYQHAYNAASRYITTIDAMLEHLIERLG